jgi:lipopolysaccharide/colanic/teichoic acid biosynthesis glycosyltransferase
MISATDGGVQQGLADIEYLGGQSRLSEVLVEHDVSTAVLAFDNLDRTGFFSAIRSCHAHGVVAKIHRNHTNAVLTTGVGNTELVDIDLEPWDPLDHVLKRVFDVVFAGLALLVLLPVILVIAIAIKLDDGGSILYTQDRTTSFGETFRITKFRSMKTTTSDHTEPILDKKNTRITHIGGLIRRTHMDEIPQLWAILQGDMSVVGPRAAWTDEESSLEKEIEHWRKRWFVKPGLTGLAQINGASSLDPQNKLRLDIKYIRQQSFYLDLKIVCRQIWIVIADILSILTGHDPEK